MKSTAKNHDQIELLINKKFNQKIKFLATKDDLKIFASKDDLKFAIENLKEELEEKLKHLPTKDEFYASMDRLMKELETIRQEVALTPSHSDLTDLEERVEILEKQVAST